MTKDLNKGISNISYNLLNLPQQVDINSPLAEATNKYSYSAGGVKLRVMKKYNSNFNTSPVIGSAVNLSSMNVTKTTDYAGNKIFENGTLDRIFVDGGYIKDGVYYFYETDHLGDNRTVVSQEDDLIERNDYYAFGMQMAHNQLTNEASGSDNKRKFSGKELDVMGGLNLYDSQARSYDPTLGRFTTVDPLASKFPWQSPYCAMDNNPINLIDPDGRAAMPPDDYVFNEKGDYVRTDKTNKPDRLVIENSQTKATQTFQFADPSADPKAIADGTINKVVVVSVAKAGDVMGKAGAFDPTNRDNEWSYMNKESKGGGKLDFSYSAIPTEFPGASADPLNTPSSMLFIPEGDGYAHNHMNFGNFLWGASGHSLGFSETTLKAAAHYNSVMNSETNGYKPQLDSKDDQLSISRGVNFSKTNQFRDRTWTPTGGLSAPPKKR